MSGPSLCALVVGAAVALCGCGPPPVAYDVSSSQITAEVKESHARTLEKYRLRGVRFSGPVVEVLRTYIVSGEDGVVIRVVFGDIDELLRYRSGDQVRAHCRFNGINRRKEVVLTRCEAIR